MKNISMNKKKIFSFDAETDGLYGKPFAIGAVVYEYINKRWSKTDEFVGKLDTTIVQNQWVIDNVLPVLSEFQVTHSSLTELLKGFSHFYLKHRSSDPDIIVHVGFPVEVNLLLECHRSNLIGDWDGPYPLIDVSSCLLHAGHDPNSVDSYIKSKNIDIWDLDGYVHNPLYDSEVTARVYIDLMG